MSYRIQLLDKSKLQETIDVCVRCFGEDWRKIADVDFPASLSDYPYRPNTLLALDGDKVVGMSVVTPVFLTPDTYSITWLCVEESYRKQGIAASLVKKSEEFVLENLLQFDKAMMILASAVNSKYYESLGYAEKCITHRDDPLMIKYLNP